MNSQTEPWFTCDASVYADRRKTRSELGLSQAALSLADGLHRDGLVILDLPFEAELLDAVQAETRTLVGQCLRAQDLWRQSQSIKALAVHPALVELLSTVYERRAFAFQTLNFPVGTEQSAHSDSMYFSSEPFGFMCGVWVALEDVTPAQGALVYYPGSHRLPVISRQALLDKGGAEAYTALQAEILDEAGLVAKSVSLKRGQAVIWAANLVHGGGAISDSRATRLSQVTHYYFEDCVYTTPIHALTGPVFIRQPFDIGAGHMARNRRQGVRVKPDFGAWKAAWTDRLLRRVHIFK